MLERKRLSLVLRATVSIIVLVYIAGKLEWPMLGELLGKVDYIWVVAAFIVFGLAWLAAAIRWYYLLQVQGVYLPLPSVGVLSLVGAFFNAFLLGSTGGDVAKLVYVFRRFPDKKAEVSLSVIMDRVLGLLMLLFLASVFILLRFEIFFQQAQTRSIAMAILAIESVLLAGAVVLLLMPFDRMPVWLQNAWRMIPLNDIVAVLLQGFRQHFHAGNTMIAAVICSIAVQLLIFISAFLLAKAVGMSVGFFDLAIIISLVICIISIPVSIGGHGVREGAFLLIFPLFSGNASAMIDNETIVIFSLLYFLLGLGWSLVGGIVYLLFDPAPSSRYTDQSF